MSAAIVPFSAASVGDWLVEAAHSREAKHRGESANASEEARRLLAPLSFNLELLLLLGHTPFSKPAARAGQAHLLPRVSASLQSPAIFLTLREDDVPDIVSICGQFAQHMTPPSPEALAVRRGPLHIAEVRSLLGWSDETEFGDCDCFVANGSFYFDAAVGQQCVPLSGVALLQRSAQSLELRWADGGRRPESKHAQQRCAARLDRCGRVRPVSTERRGARACHELPPLIGAERSVSRGGRAVVVGARVDAAAAATAAAPSP